MLKKIKKKTLLIGGPDSTTFPIIVLNPKKSIHNSSLPNLITIARSVMMYLMIEKTKRMK